MKENMRVLTQQAGRNFKIEDADFVFTDFARRGNPAKGIPSGQHATCTIRFDSPNAGSNVAQALMERFNVPMRSIVPRDGQDFEPYMSMKVEAKFEKFPPLVVMHSGDATVIMSEPRKSGEPELSLVDVAQRYENIAILDQIVIERMDMIVNVSNRDKAYIRELEVWQKVDENGNPMVRFGGRYEELSENPGE